MAATDAQMPSIGTTFGALYIGSILSCVGWGFTTNQAYVYFKTYGDEDSSSTQFLVFGLWLLDSFQVILVMHFSWFYIVAGFADPTLLSRLVWSFSVELGVTVFITFVVRTIYLNQLWRLSQGKVWLLGPALLFAAGQLALGLEICIHMLRDPNISIVRTHEFQWILGSKCVSSVMADLLITSATCYFLHASRTGFKRTNELVNSLLLYTVNRGVLAFIMETAVMITFLTMNQNFIFAALHLMLGKLHTSSLFALLLHRDTLRARQNLETTNSFSRVDQTESLFARDTQQSSNERSVDLAVMVTRETVIEHSYADDEYAPRNGRGRKKRHQYNSDRVV